MRDKASVRLEDLQETNNCIVEQKKVILGIQSEKDDLNEELKKISNRIRELDQKEQLENKKLEDMENEFLAEEKERYNDSKYRKSLVNYAMRNRKVATGNKLKPYVNNLVFDDDEESREIMDAFLQLDLDMQGEKIDIFTKFDKEIRNLFQKQLELEK